MKSEAIQTQLSVLHGLTEQTRGKLLEIGEIEDYSHGDYIFKEGEKGQDFYIILTGKVDILIDPALQGSLEQGTIGLQKVAELADGRSFGETSLLDQSPRPNSAICRSKSAKLLCISKDSITKLYQHNPQSGYQFIQNIASGLSTQLRETTAVITQKILSNHYLYFLCEELDAKSLECDGIIPLEKKLIIRDRAHFILSGPNRISSVLPASEDINLAFFAVPDVLHTIMRPGVPSGAMILNTLFTQIGNTELDQAASTELFEPIRDPDSFGHSGGLIVHKQYTSQDDLKKQTFFLQWEVKGVCYEKVSATTTAHIFIHIAYDRDLINKPVEGLISTINMPIQQHIVDRLPEKSKLQHHNPYHLLVIHHRTHEVVMTLRALDRLGFKIDTFIGIPYGDSNWPSMRMLDHVSGKHYQCLRMIEHPTEPTSYQFDFKQSSFLHKTEEEKYINLYAQTDASHDYMAAMTTLIEIRLGHSIKNCIQENQKLLIYEDGGYIVPLIYRAYHEPAHALHVLVKQAVDEKIIEGAVEVTVAGERRNLSAVETYGRALLPVLSTARDDLKAIFEAKGVSQAVIDSTSSALGRLGLPTFETRKVAVIGGNGAIGTRLVEELTEMQNTPSSVFAVDIVDQAFSREIDAQRFPHAAIKVDYLNLGRYLVHDTCLPVIVDLSFGSHTLKLRSSIIQEPVQSFFSNFHDSDRFDELVITNSFPSSFSLLETLWQQMGDLSDLWKLIHQKYGYAPTELKLLPNGQGVSQIFEKQENSQSFGKKVTLLTPEQVLLFRKVSRLIQNGIDTVIGVVGLPIFDEDDVNAFLTRHHSGNATDELVLSSASSKNYEFKKAITLLDELLAILTDNPIAIEHQLTFYQKLYKHKMCFVMDDDAIIIDYCLSGPVTSEVIAEKLKQCPEFIVKNGFDTLDVDQLSSQLAELIRNKIKRNLGIRKSLYKDIGTIYHIQLGRKLKKLVLLANGFVINFFAEHEKGVKTEYIDPIVTMQFLGLVKLATTEVAIQPGIYRMAQHLKSEDMDLFWQALDDKSRPIVFSE